MDTHINVELISRNIGSLDEVVVNMPQYTTCVKKHNFFIENEIQISECLHKIPHWQLYYDCIHFFKRLSQTSECFIAEDGVPLNLLRDEGMYTEEGTLRQAPIVCKYLQYKNVDFDDFFLSLPTPRLMIFHAIDSYYHLLNSLYRLEKLGICYYNFSPEYLSFDEYYKPRITKFDTSIQIEQLNEQLITRFIRATKDFTHKPLEVHLVFYLIANNVDMLTDDLIIIICDKFVGNLDVLKLFSQRYNDLHRNECLSFLTRYVNKGRTEILVDVLKYIDTWDNYGLSMLYSHLFGNITITFSLKGTIMSNLLDLFVKNISPLPENRNNIQNTITAYKKLYCDFKDWSFVEQIHTDVDLLCEKLRG
jgi:hypothetical protein